MFGRALDHYSQLGVIDEVTLLTLHVLYPETEIYEISTPAGSGAIMGDDALLHQSLIILSWKTTPHFLFNQGACYPSSARATVC